MQYAVLVLSLSFVAGCGGGDGLTPDDGSVGGGDDLAVVSGNDLATSSNKSDMKPPAVTCDPIKQDCTDPTQKCAIVTSMGKTAANCVTPAPGMVAEGGACMRAMGAGMGDNCDKGLTCQRVGGGGGGGGGGTSVCRKICKSDGDCTGGAKCTSAGGQASTYGACTPTCTLLGTDCGTGMTCGTFAVDIASTTAQVIAVPVCRATGATPAYGDCMRASDCVANTTCDGNGKCAPICDGSHICPQPAVDGGAFSCQPLGGLPNNGGSCG